MYLVYDSTKGHHQLWRFPPALKLPAALFVYGDHRKILPSGEIPRTKHHCAQLTTLPCEAPKPRSPFPSPSNIMESGRAKKKKPLAYQKPKAAAFSAGTPHVQEIHLPKSLVGSIVEKGFSSSPPHSDHQKPYLTSLPQPTVLPFPVARHRSHGPHWNPPLAAAPEVEEDPLEDVDGTDYAPISAFANPVERKEKKGLNFSKWRDFVPGNGSTASQLNKKGTKINEEKKKIPSTASSFGRDEAYNELLLGTSELATASKRARPSSDLVRLDGESAMEFSQSDGAKLTIGGDKKHINSGGGTDLLMPDGQGFGSTMDDIHAENLARLTQMAPEEIVEAQTEIMEKLNPAVIEMLKRRGRDRLGMRKTMNSKQEKGGQDMISDHLVDNGKTWEKNAEPSSKDVKSSKLSALHGDWMSAYQFYSSSWKIWSERVEKVRDLRFSLEGNVLEANSHPLCDGFEPKDGRLDVGNVVERDFLRTEGDPAALGYTIKEAIALIRSMVPAQRAFALKLLHCILNKTLFNLLNKKSRYDMTNDCVSNHIDWQAVWAYALGPEPQLVLSLRIALDDNHQSVVLACAKVIQCILSCDTNENFFNAAEKVPTIKKVLCTAPVFRSRPEVNTGFLQGGFWKYSTKSSNILPSTVDNQDDEGEEKLTIQDDVVVAGQDIVAGLVRMGILPRICYLLEMEPLPALVECLATMLIGLGRHSPTCANAINQCPRLIQNVVNILTRQGMMELPCQIKAITVLKVLFQMDKCLCANFVKGGVFQQVMWHWYRSPHTIEQWLQSGKEHCKLTAALIVEQLRLWKVCISYGYCIAYFADFFPHMCLWLDRPTFNKLIEFNVLDEFAYIAREAYLTLGALSEWLPCLHSRDQLNKPDADLSVDDMETWSWSHVVPIVDLALNWLVLKDIPYVSLFTDCFGEKYIYNSSVSSMIWVMSAVLHMLCSIFDRMTPKSAGGGNNATTLPWLPEFVPKVGLTIVKIGFLSFSSLGDIEQKGTKSCSLIEGLCFLRHQDDLDLSLSSISCLHGLVQLASLIDKCIERARSACDIQLLMGSSSVMEDKILAEGMMKWAKEDLTRVMDAIGNLVVSEWPMVQSLEAFGRGGPAPGVGVGWGSPVGGFWSFNVLLAQTDARLALELFRTLGIMHERDLNFVEATDPAVGIFGDQMNFALKRVNCLLAICLVAGPADRDIVEAALDILCQPSVLKYLGFCLHHFLCYDKRMNSLKWQYEENDYLILSKILNSHFRERWLSSKNKSSTNLNGYNQSHGILKKGGILETIHETQEDEGIPELPSKYTACSSFCTQWVHQRLPVPMQWFLSAICSISEQKNSGINSSELLDVAKSGLFFLLCLEALSSLLLSVYQESPTHNVSVVWKVHALSMSLHVNMAVLEEEKTRDVFESLQKLYGKELDELSRKAKNQEFQGSSMPLSKTHESACELLSFQLQINDSYSTFIENLIEQFGAVSYGDIIFGRQVAIYLHRSVDIPVRLAAWNALSNAHLLELIPPLEMCMSEAEGYLEPSEDNEGILEAYAKSWTSGCLDRAVTRGSLSFSLALHHLFSFIFKNDSLDKLKLRNKLTKSLLRSYSNKHHNDIMLVHLVKYKLPMPQVPLHTPEIVRRFELLTETCEGNSSLIAVVERLKSAL